jgi:glycosyltransferase involved in cell wall biosynthesis
MRVVQLGPYPPPHGGVQTNLVAIRDLVRTRGHDGYAVNLTRNRRADSDDVFYPKSAFELIRLLLRLKADVLHVHIGGDFTLRLLGLTLFCTLVPGARTVMTFHSGGYPSSPVGRTARRRTLRGFVLRRLDGVIAVNDEIARMFHTFGVAEHRVRTILPFAVQLPDPGMPLPERLSAWLASHDPVLFTVGLLEPEYDLSLQIDAMGGVLKRYPKAGLLIAGSGSLESDLRAHIAATPHREHVLLYGDMPHAVTLRTMLSCRALLRTTRYDGDSVSVREALYIGTPVIATDNGMRPPGMTLIPVGDAAALVQAIQGVVQGAARRPAAGDGQENIRAVIALYEELVRRPARGADVRNGVLEPQVATQDHSRRSIS